MKEADQLMPTSTDRVVQVTSQSPHMTGIYAILVTILLALVGAIASGFYWGGNISKGQQASEQSNMEIKGQLQYLQAQFQTLDAKVARIEGQQGREQRERDQDRSPRKGW